MSKISQTGPASHRGLSNDRGLAAGLDSDACVHHTGASSSSTSKLPKSKSRAWPFETFGLSVQLVS